MARKNQDFLNRHYMKIIASVVVGFLLFTYFLFKPQQPRSQTKIPQPNIVFILTDDLDSSSIAYMPKLQSYIASQGTMFSKFYLNMALCCPSRVTILRGQYSHNSQITSNASAQAYQKFKSLGEENSTVATWLHDSGYKTVLMGKYMNGYPGAVNRTWVPPGWSEWYATVKNEYVEYNYTLNENGVLKDYGSTPADYETDVIASKAADFIIRNQSSPLFMYLAPYAPHGPATPAPRHANLFTNLKVPQTPSFNEADMSDKPTWINSIPLLSTSRINAMSSLYVKRLQSLQAVDDMIETVINTLQTTGKLDNTYIVLTSDNGFHQGQHRLDSGKDTAYEEDVIAPLLIRGPGVPAGITINSIVGNVDFAPTFAELAGVTAPTFVDGRSFVSLLTGIPPLPGVWRNAFLLERGACSSEVQTSPQNPGEYPDTSSLNPNLPLINLNKPCTTPFTAIRTTDDFYVEYTNGEREYYNVTLDPYELINTYSTADPNLIAALSSQLNLLKTCVGITCQQLDNNITPTPTPIPTNTPIPTDTPTPVPTDTPIPTDTPTPIPTDTPTPTP